MNVAAILKLKGKGVFTASADTSLLEIAKLLEQHGIGCIVIEGKEGPLNYKMSGDYIVVSPIPQNMVLRYGNRMASLWTTRRIIPPAQQPAPVTAPPSSEIAQRMAATPVVQAPQVQQAPAQPRTSAPQDETVRLANVTALYTDKLTDGR